jgi:hypothetical protein
MIMKEYKPTRHQTYMMNKHSRYQKLLLSLMRFERQNDGLPEVKLINGKKSIVVSGNITIIKRYIHYQEDYKSQ